MAEEIQEKEYITEKEAGLSRNCFGRISNPIKRKMTL